MDEAQDALGGLVSPDRASLVLFDGVGRVVVEPTLDPGRVRTALDTVQPGWGGTQIGAGLQAASGILQASDRSRREVVLISDFQRRGWEDGPRDPLPEGTTFVTADVGDDGLGSMIVSDVTLEYTFQEGRQRVQPSARVVRQGEQAPTSAEISIEIDGQEVEATTIEMPSDGAVSVPFAPITLPPDAILGTVHVDAEGGREIEPFRFVVSPSEVLSVVLVEDGDALGEEAPYLRRALEVQGGVPMQVEIRRTADFSEAELEGVDLVILNDVPLPAGGSGTALQSHLRGGGGLLVAAGPGSDADSWSTGWNEFIPARPGEIVERDPAMAASLAQVDRDHPVFTVFDGEGGSGLGAPRFFRYRRLDVPEPDPADGEGTATEEQDPRVLARLDDGTPILAQRTTGAGRVLVWTSTFDNEWSDFPAPPGLPPRREGDRAVHRRAAGERSLLHGGPAPRPPLSSSSRPGCSRREPPRPGRRMEPRRRVRPSASWWVPTGRPSSSSRTGGRSSSSAPPGSTRSARRRRGGTEWVLAVNPDVREADPARIDPEELTIAVAPESTAEGRGRGRRPGRRRPLAGDRSGRDARGRGTEAGRMALPPRRRDPPPPRRDAPRRTQETASEAGGMNVP